MCYHNKLRNCHLINQLRYRSVARADLNGSEYYPDDICIFELIIKRRYLVHIYFFADRDVFFTVIKHS